ncbi:MAG: TaqI family restriction endonuclease [Elusimicrobiota bacterium]|nr:TaqI family restriction endonuclease [Elusimicrobiota bacterium]
MNDNPVKNLDNYRHFLSSIPLSKYREELIIKWVEQDLHSALFPQKSIFHYYWDEKEFLGFEEWFDAFWNNLITDKNLLEKVEDFKALVRAHRKFYEDKINSEHEKRFFLGFKARMYRTWISVLTQLDFCYLFDALCVKKKMNLKVECNYELDVIEGIDAKVNEVGFQIAKISDRKVAQKISRKKRVITIPYAVFPLEEYKRKSQSSRVQEKSRIAYKNALVAFHKYFISLDNGFVVFHENYLSPVIDNINDIDKINEIVKQITLELAGE